MIVLERCGCGGHWTMTLSVLQELDRRFPGWQTTPCKCKDGSNSPLIPAELAEQLLKQPTTKEK